MPACPKHMRGSRIRHWSSGRGATPERGARSCRRSCAYRFRRLSRRRRRREPCRGGNSDHSTESVSADRPSATASARPVFAQEAAQPPQRPRGARPRTAGGFGECGAGCLRLHDAHRSRPVRAAAPDHRTSDLGPRGSTGQCRGREAEGTGRLDREGRPAADRNGPRTAGQDRGLSRTDPGGPGRNRPGAADVRGQRDATGWLTGSLTAVAVSDGARDPGARSATGGRLGTTDLAHRTGPAPLSKTRSWSRPRTREAVRGTRPDRDDRYRDEEDSDGAYRGREGPPLPLRRGGNDQSACGTPEPASSPRTGPHAGTPRTWMCRRSATNRLRAERCPIRADDWRRWQSVVSRV